MTHDAAHPAWPRCCGTGSGTDRGPYARAARAVRSRPAAIARTAYAPVGLAAIGLAAVVTVIGATMAATSSPAVSDLLLVAGAVLSMLGFGACGPWLLERLERVAAWLPLAGRIAFCDTARARSRSSPIVTAILAGLAAAVAIGAWPPD